MKLKLLVLSLLVSNLLFAQQNLRDSADAFFDKNIEGVSYNSTQWQDVADAALAIDSTNGHLWQLKGMPYLKAGDWQNAFLYYNKAIALDPEHSLPYVAFCKTIFLKDYESAQKDFAFIQKNANYDQGLMDHSVFYFEALCYHGMQNYAKANAMYLKILQQAGTEKMHYAEMFHLACSFYRLKNYDAAAKYFQIVLKTYPQFPDVHYYLSKIATAQNNNVLAKKQMQLAQQFCKQGYTINEDNQWYAYYPETVGIADITDALHALP